MDKDIELYGVVPVEENTWHMMGGDGEIIKTITKDIVVDYCKSEYENNGDDCLDIETMMDSVWWRLNDDLDVGLIDCFCQYWDEFLTWLNNICAEYVKQRLDDFE